MTFLPFDELLGFEASDKRLDILRRVGEAGSISKAARSAGVSYKAAWQAIEALTNLAGTPLINTAVGGSGGGGAVLTSAGQKLLVVAAAFAQARQQLLAQLAELTDTEVAGVTSPAVAAGLRTSMRNQFPCVVDGLAIEDGQVTVTLMLSDTTLFCARVTQESAELLGLCPGMPVLALFKATAVSVGPSPAAVLAQQPGINLFYGEVRRSAQGIDTEVGLMLPAGIHLTGFAAEQTVLSPGDAAVAWVSPAAVVIAVTERALALI